MCGSPRPRSPVTEGRMQLTGRNALVAMRHTTARKGSQLGMYRLHSPLRLRQWSFEGKQISVDSCMLVVEIKVIEAIENAFGRDRLVCVSLKSGLSSLGALSKPPDSHLLVWLPAVHSLSPSLCPSTCPSLFLSILNRLLLCVLFARDSEVVTRASRA